MALVIKEVSSNTVTEVGNVIIIEGGGLTPDQTTKLANVPSDTNTELALKAPLASPAFTGTPTGITKSHVGLGNVDNTSDANKPVSTLQQIALDLKADLTDIDTINTTLSIKADLGGDGKVPAAQLPDSLDEILEYANLAAFPATGATNKIYVALDTNKTYRWSGTVYAETSTSLALGSTSSTAHRGDHGATAYTHSQVTSGNPHSVTKSDVGLSNVDNTSDANKPVSTAQQAALDSKANLASPTFTGTVSGITKTMVGLENVDNTSDLNKPISTATQAALDLKAEPGDYAAAISITGTHDETTTAIDFSSVQGKAITLTANRSYSISGLSASNPVGILKITHAGFTPSFSGVTALDSPVNKSGVYYLRFVRQADGAIIQTNQSGGGGASTLEELSGITTTTAKVNLLDNLIAGFKAGTPSVATSLSGTDITLTITPGTEDSRFATTLYNIYRSTDDVTYSLYDTEATTEYIDSGLENGTYYYKVSTVNAITESDLSTADSETVASSEILYDDFTSSLNANWVHVNPGSFYIEAIQNSGELRIDAKTVTSTAALTNYLDTPTDNSGVMMVAIDFVANTVDTTITTQLMIFVDSNNYISCYNRTDNQNALFLIKQAGTTYAAVDSGYTAVGNRFAISIDGSNRIRYYRWNTSVWEEINSATVKTYDIGATKKGRIDYRTSGTNIGYATFDRFRCDNAIYATELP